MIIGACGVPLSYGIHKTDWQFDADIPYDEAIIHAISLEGDEFCLNAWTVHQLIIMNVINDSDTYRYVHIYQDVVSLQLAVAPSGSMIVLGHC